MSKTVHVDNLVGICGNTHSRKRGPNASAAVHRDRSGSDVDRDDGTTKKRAKRRW